MGRRLLAGRIVRRRLYIANKSSDFARCQASAVVHAHAGGRGWRRNRGQGGGLLRSRTVLIGIHGSLESFIESERTTSRRCGATG